ncbi:MAG: DNA double-strand break repair nuclease NurA [Chloroflexota bacterium]|nr:DNA double-strand break repair nuclease NurA [Chloroflexota bacterium]
MPVNLLEIQKKLNDFSAQAAARKQKLASRQREVSNLIEGYADRLDDLREQVDRAASMIPHLRCAVPRDEALDTVVPKPNLPRTFTVLAADGSQINPSRHAQVEFCVINVGVVKMMRGSGLTPEIYTHSQLLDYDAVFLPSGGMISEGMVALKRDLREREALAKLMGDLQPPAISMTDGPLELYREPHETAEFAKTLDRYLDVLASLRDQGLITLGYVDKPGSDLIGRLLELAQMTDDDLAAYNRRRRRFAGVSDRQLMTDILVNPGDRSALFGIHSQTALRFRGDLALHFFYINVGEPGKPHLARVEVPNWVAGDRMLVGLIQAVLLEQASIMGTRPYPYILHRAHEVAVVTLPEHQHVEEMIVAEFQRRGIPIDEKSNKQYHKDLDSTKTRYQA